MNSNRMNISSGSPWESLVGYSRAVRVGNSIHVAGTTAVDDEGKVIGVNDVAKQTRFVLEKISLALKEAGASLSDVVRTRMYVTNIDEWEKIGRIHGQFFSEIRPAATMVEVSRLIDSDLLIEIEVEAILEGEEE